MNYALSFDPKEMKFTVVVPGGEYNHLLKLAEELGGRVVAFTLNPREAKRAQGSGGTYLGIFVSDLGVAAQIMKRVDEAQLVLHLSRNATRKVASQLSLPLDEGATKQAPMAQATEPPDGVPVTLFQLLEKMKHVYRSLENVQQPKLDSPSGNRLRKAVAIAYKKATDTYLESLEHPPLVPEEARDLLMALLNVALGLNNKGEMTFRHLAALSRAMEITAIRDVGPVQVEMDGNVYNFTYSEDCFRAIGAVLSNVVLKARSKGGGYAAMREAILEAVKEEAS